MVRDSWSSRPLDTPAAVKNLLKYDIIYCAELIVEHHRPAWRYLRKNHPEQLLLSYVSGNSARMSGGFEYLDYNYINRYHPEWFLLSNPKNQKQAEHKDLEKRMRWDANKLKLSDYNRFFLDVGNKNFQNWAAQQIVKRVSGEHDNLTYSYDGLVMDNVLLDVWHKYITKRYPYWKYADSPERWSAANFEYLDVVKKALNKKGFILVVNQTLDYSSDIDGQDWDILAESVDGMMDEKALAYTRTNYFTDDKWLASIQRHEEIIEKGLIDLWVCYPRESGTRAHEDFLYTYCSWLLVKKDKKSFYYASRGVKAYNDPAIPWYHEYDLPIGEPVAKRYRKGNCWLRDYKDAKIVVNPTKNSQRVVIDNKKLWLDWVSQKTVSEIEIHPAAGRILLPTPYTAN